MLATKIDDSVIAFYKKFKSTRNQDVKFIKGLSFDFYKKINSGLYYSSPSFHSFIYDLITIITKHKCWLFPHLRKLLYSYCFVYILFYIIFLLIGCSYVFYENFEILNISEFIIILYKIVKVPYLPIAWFVRKIISIIKWPFEIIFKLLRIMFLILSFIFKILKHISLTNSKNPPYTEAAGKNFTSWNDLKEKDFQNQDYLKKAYVSSAENELNCTRNKVQFFKHITHTVQQFKKIGHSNSFAMDRDDLDSKNAAKRYKKALYDAVNFNSKSCYSSMQLQHGNKTGDFSEKNLQPYSYWEHLKRYNQK